MRDWNDRFAPNFGRSDSLYDFPKAAIISMQPDVDDEAGSCDSQLSTAASASNSHRQTAFATADDRR